jgi:hypothetical protein
MLAEYPGWLNCLWKMAMLNKVVGCSGYAGCLCCLCWLSLLDMMGVCPGYATWLFPMMAG